jgi:Fic-DOC domain mobile mystery protein B
MKFKPELPYGATPLDPDEMGGLLIDSNTTQSELNSAEQESILNSSQWIFGRNHKNILTDTFFKELHHKMFGSVWTWAGKYRKSNKNIGIDWPDVSVEVKKICDDTRYWIENKTYSRNDLGARFHHRVVWIHPFSNGNGRFSRILTDLLMKQSGLDEFSWGQKLGKADDFVQETQLRKEYIAALREADQKKFDRLIAFMHG